MVIWDAIWTHSFPKMNSDISTTTPTLMTPQNLEFWLPIHWKLQRLITLNGRFYNNGSYPWRNFAQFAPTRQSHAISSSYRQTAPTTSVANASANTLLLRYLQFNYLFISTYIIHLASSQYLMSPISSSIQFKGPLI